MLQYLWGWYPERTNSVSDFWKFPPQHQRCRPTCLRWFPSNLHLLYITLWSDPLLLHYHAAFQFSFLIYMQYTHITSVCNMLHFEFFLTFLPVVVRYSLFVSLSVLHFCTGGVFAVFPSPFRHSGCIVRCPLHCIGLHCPPLLVSHLLSSLDWPWGSPSKFFIH